jgi:hypothetical protein
MVSQVNASASRHHLGYARNKRQGVFLDRIFSEPSAKASARLCGCYHAPLINRIYEAGVGVKTQFRRDAERRKFEFG